MKIIRPGKFFHLISLLVVMLPGIQSAPIAVLEDMQASPVDTAAFSLADLGEKDRSIKTIFDRFLVHFQVAEGRKIEKGQLQLHLAHSQKLLPAQSELAIELNDEPAFNLPLTPENAADSIVMVDLPPKAIRHGENTFGFRFQLRLGDKACIDTRSPDLWVKIFADSKIELTSSDRVIEPDLGRFPAPFNSLSTLPGNAGLTFVLPAQPTSVEMTAAAQIAAAIGQSAGWETPPLTMVTADRLGPQRAAADHLIAIDTARRNPLAANAVPGLTETVSPYNPARLLLIVSGPDVDMLLQSAALLATKSARKLLSGTQVASQPVIPLPILEQPEQATFADLGFSIRRVEGIGQHDLYYPIDIPHDWKITNDATIELHFSHAEDLSSSSLVNTFINGYQVASVPLTNHNESDGRLVIHLSSHQIQPGRNWLHLSFDLYLEEEDCSDQYSDEVWAEISAEDSIANLAHVNTSPPMDVSFLLSLLVTPTDLSGDWFILPEQAGEAEYSAVVRMAAKLGASSDADGLRPRVTSSRWLAGNILPQDIRIIAIGTPENNSLLARYNDALPQPLARVNGVIQPAVGRQLMVEELQSQAGYLQVLPAPGSPGDTLLVISAPNEALLWRLIDVLPMADRRLKAQGNVAIITQEKVNGLSIGLLAGAPLSGLVRLALAVVLIGGFALILVIGIVINHRKQTKQQVEFNEKK